MLLNASVTCNDLVTHPGANHTRCLTSTERDAPNRIAVKASSTARLVGNAYKSYLSVTIPSPSRSFAPETYTQRNLVNITWVRQLLSGSCHYPTSDNKCNAPNHIAVKARSTARLVGNAYKSYLSP